MENSQPVADHSVRIAWEADAEAIGRIQTAAWGETYASLLPQIVLDHMSAQAFEQSWRKAIARPPSARHRVLVALDSTEVVGFAATAPSDDQDAEPTQGEVVAFHIAPQAFGQGHGSRLLTAVTDTMRADDFTHGRMWVVVGDDPLRRFLESTGWAADSAHRTLDLTDDVDPRARLRQVRLHTDLRSDDDPKPA